MPDRGSWSAPVRSAGAVVWRPGPDGGLVAVIHRERYDDWSLPKGKREPGEHTLAPAAREVREETGCVVTLGRRLGQTRYDSHGDPKVVDYWAATVADPASAAGEFTPNDEVDKLEWLPAAAARARLSYERDEGILAEFAAGPPVTVPVILLRHASAGRRHDWGGQDLARPLDARGAAGADLLAPLLGLFGRCALVSSAAERCVATVRPYAALTGVPIEVDPLLAVDRGRGMVPEQAARAAAVVAAGKPAIICGHRENLPGLLAAACGRLGAVVPAGRPLRKAGFWVLHTADGALAGAERYDPEG